MQPLPDAHRALTPSELYAMANGFLRPTVKRPSKTTARREKPRELPAQSRFVAPPTVRPRIVGPSQVTPRTMPDYPVWDGIERI